MVALSACGGSDDEHPAPLNIVQTAQANAQFSILVEAVTAADLGTTLSGTGPFTVFAPTNDAFAALLTELNLTKAPLLADMPLLTVFAPTNAAFAALLTELNVTKPALLANTALLTKVLTFHVVSGLVLKAQVPVGTPVSTVEKVTFSVSAALAITDKCGRVANITATDALTSNGVIRVIDKVILPAP